MNGLPPLRLFLDRSSHAEDFVKGVKAMCPDTMSIDEKYGVKAAETVPDETWLAEATQEGRICVGADKKILSSARPAEIAAVLRYGARCLVYASNNLRTSERLALIRMHLPAIRELTGTPGLGPTPWPSTTSS